MVDYLRVEGDKLKMFNNQIKKSTEDIKWNHIICSMKSNEEAQSSIWFNSILFYSFPSESVVKNLPANEETLGDVGLFPGWGRSLEEEMATHSSVLARIIPGTGEPGGLTVQGVTKSQTRLSDSACWPYPLFKFYVAIE